MIVYFSKKSKKIALGWGIFMGGLYMVFVFGNILQGEVITIQILRSQSKFEVQKVDFEQKSQEARVPQGFSFVASKRGVYYYPINCSRAQALSVKNMLYFKDKTAAERAGYKAHKDCF
jgi:hypothetical protein